MQGIRGILAEGLREVREAVDSQKDFDDMVSASMVIAMVNGLAMQFIIDKKATEFPRAYLYFQLMLKDFLGLSET
ncbi:MAG: hypothetical protein SWK76_03665 [Actinomycetota bacterium]|nr:hypothetical protein [Actinomycetota bacterium]